MTGETAVDVGTREIVALERVRGVGRQALVGGMRHPSAEHDENIAREARRGHAAFSRNSAAQQQGGLGADNYLG